MTAISHFKIILKPLWICLQLIEKWEDLDVANEAYSMRSSIQTFDFIIGLVSIEDILGFMSPTVKMIQRKRLDIVSALELLDKMTNDILVRKTPFYFTREDKKTLYVAGIFENTNG